MGRFEVTEAQWRSMTGNEPLSAAGDSFPVESLGWDSAQRFCEALTQQTGRTYRLPSEAEWEYACRAGTSTVFHFGSMLTSDLASFGEGAGRYALFPSSGTPAPRGLSGSSQVGCFPANAFGLHDMHGNVWGRPRKFSCHNRARNPIWVIKSALRATAGGQS